MAVYKDKGVNVVHTFNAKWLAVTHTALGYTAFFSALIIGCLLHYHKIVQNEWYGFPEEWFPSVSAAIGDRYPERAFYQVFIALSTGPRFALIGLFYLLARAQFPRAAKYISIVGAVRTLALGGFTFVTSTDDHDSHDVFMILYMVATIPWTVGCTLLTQKGTKARRYRKAAAWSFFGVIPFMVYFYIQHKVRQIPGAYTIYAFFEWSLIISDVAFDTVCIVDFSDFEISIRDVSGRPTVGIETLPKSSDKFTVIGLIDTVLEVYHGYVFWSIITSLGVTVWYFPLWFMGISGYEALILTSVLPAILYNNNVYSWVVKNQRLCHLLSLTCIASYMILDPIPRVFAIGFGVALASLSWAATFSSETGQEGRLQAKIMAWILGLALSSTAKYAWFTNNPIWPIMHENNGGMNGVGLLVAIVAVFRFTRMQPLTPVARTAVKNHGYFSSWLSACAVGGLFFGLHSLLSDSSTMILWTWEGFPLRGPESATHGYFTLLSMTLGAFFGLYNPNWTSSLAFYAFGCSGAYYLTMERHWTGFAGALVIAFYLMAASVPFLTSAAKKAPAVSFGLGFFLYVLMVLFHVWVVAYAFVPAGPIFRERTDGVMLCLMALMGCGHLERLIYSPAKPKQFRATFSAPQINNRKGLGLVAFAMNILFLFSAYQRLPTNDYTPYHADERLFTAGIWTIHFSLDNDMWSSQHRMRDLIKELEVDVIGLLESDSQRIIMGNRDTTQFLANDLGMYVDYGPGPNKHTWGAALLSKFPILNSTHHLLPSPVGELAPAIHATLDVYGELVDIFVFHSGQEEDEEDRRLQSEYLAELMGSTPRPAVLLSYLVTEPLDGNYNTYVSEKSGMHDVDPTDWDRWCEYILYKNLRRTGYARVSRSSITDTELQLAKFVVPKDEDEKELIYTASDENRDRRIKEEKTPIGQRFPKMFRGKGVRGHRYHVFDEPRYYKY